MDAHEELNKVLDQLKAESDRGVKPTITDAACLTGPLYRAIIAEVKQHHRSSKE